jgi:hypothetical protein
MMKLTFYRVVAELGVSARFLFSPYINHRLCGNYRGCDNIEGSCSTLLLPLLCTPTVVLCFLSQLLLRLPPFKYSYRVTSHHVTLTEQMGNSDQCAPWSGMLQFFLLASELWFLCTAFDFAVTLSNPFSPFSDRCVCG